MTPMPGLLADLTGTTVEEYTFVGAVDGTVYMEWDGRQLDTGIFNDILEAGSEDVKVLARYTSNYYEGKPALTEHALGEGRVLHFGGTFTRDTVQALLAYVGILSPYEAKAELPGECELCVRAKAGKRYYFILNYSAGEREICLKQEMTDLCSGQKRKGRVCLKGYETIILAE